MSRILVSVQVAAEWWANQLREKKVIDDLGPDQASVRNALILALGDTMGRVDISEEQAGEFEAELAVRVNYELVERDPPEDKVLLKVDYELQGMLEDVADTLGLERLKTVFPRKTVMWVSRTQVSVREGYGSDKRILYDASYGRIE